ncbi:hypothetical protein GJ496_001971 [Pomphorhynchus laevis]|nr:hypothetical protein GJ496_001971 [Pomphorhynchus laevis]
MNLSCCLFCKWISSSVQLIEKTEVVMLTDCIATFLSFSGTSFEKHYNTVYSDALSLSKNVLRGNTLNTLLQRNRVTKRAKWSLY